jgi:hypothetical protein
MLMGAILRIFFFLLISRICIHFFFIMNSFEKFLLSGVWQQVFLIIFFFSFFHFRIMRGPEEEKIDQNRTWNKNCKFWMLAPLYLRNSKKSLQQSVSIKYTDKVLWNIKKKTIKTIFTN